MAIEHTVARAVPKPWGSDDLRPWSELKGKGAIGELWFERSDKKAETPALLLKLLFTTAPLSIQVHPDDVFAKSLGLANGKTEAWYILSAKPGSKVAVGLKRRLSNSELRAAIEKGSISELIQWRVVAKGDVVFVPAGTIHAIGGGLVVAEIQQRSDSTFRIFDFGRKRELQIDNAVAVAHARPIDDQPAARRLTEARTLLLANPHFVLEQVDFASKSNWEIHAERETWVLVLDGQAWVGSINTFIGEAVFLEADSTRIQAGANGARVLIAYAGPDARLDMLREADERVAESTVRPAASAHIINRAIVGSSPISAGAQP